VFEINKFAGHFWWCVNFNSILDLINSTKMYKLVDDIQLMLHQNLELSKTWGNKLWSSNFLIATFFSILFVIFYWSIIYLDSNKPGENPPTPFGSMQKRR
jgi:hypothetical protein